MVQKITKQNALSINSVDFHSPIPEKRETKLGR